MSGLNRTFRITATGAMPNSGRIQNNFKGGMSVMGYARGSGATAGAVINIYGSSALVDATARQTLVATVHPTTTTAGVAGVIDVLPNVICFWDYLFVEFVSPEGTTNFVEVDLSGREVT